MEKLGETCIPESISIRILLNPSLAERSIFRTQRRKAAGTKQLKAFYSSNDKFGFKHTMKSNLIFSAPI